MVVVVVVVKWKCLRVMEWRKDVEGQKNSQYAPQRNS
jgi:hypothetical protein